MPQLGWYKHKHCHILESNVPSIFFLAGENFSLLGGHFGHLNKNILYTRPVQGAHKKCNFYVLFVFDLTLDFN